MRPSYGDPSHRHSKGKERPGTRTPSIGRPKPPFMHVNVSLRTTNYPGYAGSLSRVARRRHGHSSQAGTGVAQAVWASRPPGVAAATQSTRLEHALDGRAPVSPEAPRIPRWAADRGGGGEREEPRFRCAGPIRRPAWMGAIKASGRVVKRGGGGVLFGRIQNATLTMGCSSSLRLSYGRSALYVISCLPEEDRARAFRSPSRRARLDNGRGARTRINSGPTWHMDPAPARARCVKRGVVFFGFSDGEGGLFTAVCVLEMSTRSRTSYEKMAEKFWKKRAVGAQPRRQNGTEPSRMRWKLRESRGARRATVASGLARPRYGTGQQLLYPGAGPRKAP